MRGDVDRLRDVEAALLGVSRGATLERGAPASARPVAGSKKCSRVGSTASSTSAAGRGRVARVEHRGEHGAVVREQLAGVVTFVGCGTDGLRRDPRCVEREDHMAL